jgi:hypothetical protein
MMPTKATGENELKRKELKLKQLKGKEDESARKCEESLKVKEQKRFVHLFTLFVTSAGVLISLCRISNAAGNTRVERSVPWQGIPMPSERSVPRQRFFFFFFFAKIGQLEDKGERSAHLKQRMQAGNQEKAKR